MTTARQFPSDEADKFVVRLPDGMRDRLKASAKSNNRTLNAEIVSRLQASFDGPSVVSKHTRTAATPDDMELLYAITKAHMELQQSTMALGDAREEAFRLSSVLERRERDLRDSKELGRGEAFVSVHQDAYNKALKEFNKAQQAVKNATADVRAKQSDLSNLYQLREAKNRG